MNLRTLWEDLPALTWLPFSEILEPYNLDSTTVYFTVLLLLGLRSPDSWFNVPVVMSGFQKPSDPL